MTLLLKTTFAFALLLSWPQHKYVVEGPDGRLHVETRPAIPFWDAKP